MDWDLKIFEFCNLQESIGGGGQSGPKVWNLLFFLIESFLPLRLLIWAWNFHFICFEKFRVVVGGGWWVVYLWL